MKFRRKSAASAPEHTGQPDQPEQPDPAEQPGQPEPGGSPVAGGPWDEDDLPAELRGIERADLGSLLLTGAEGREVQLQVDEQSGTIAAVMIGDAEGAIELRAFAAPRNAATWEEVLPELEADVAQRGGSHARREGPWGTELLCQIAYQLPDGQSAVQPSRIVGIDGPRWMLRATFLGRPAVDESVFAEWEDILRTVVVRRGTAAMPKGEALPLVMPAGSRRIEG